MWRRSDAHTSPYAEPGRVSPDQLGAELSRFAVLNTGNASNPSDDQTSEDGRIRRPSVGVDSRRAPSVLSSAALSSAVRGRVFGSLENMSGNQSPNFSFVRSSPSSPLANARVPIAPPPPMEAAPLIEPEGDLTSYQLVEVATAWAQRNNFSVDQLVEFSHLMQMIGLTYIPRNQVTQYRELDRGTFGTIYKALYDGTPVAVKQLSTDGSQIQLKMREVVLELQVLGKIFPGHPNIVTFWGTAASFPTSRQTGKPYVGLIFELCENGSLYKAIHSSGRCALSFNDKIRVALEIARGMAFLHSKAIIHRDLNSRNVLLDSNMRAKIADFGCARKVKGLALVTTTISGTAAYMAPEQMEGKDLTDKIDVWAFGVVLWELLSEQGPWSRLSNDLAAIKRAVIQQNERLPPPPQECFAGSDRGMMLQLMDMTWSTNPASRPNMIEAARTIETATRRAPTVAVGEFL